MLRRALRSPRALVLLVLVAAAGTAGGILAARATDSGRHATNVAEEQPASHPNIVFVLTDDLSSDLVPYMPQVQALEQHGLTFQNYFVSDSLCCPSRSSIFTGNLPHDTQVFSNFGPDGGFNAFYSRGEEQHTFAVALQRAGYLTAMMGKYLNGYLAKPGKLGDGSAASAASANYVPPGWSDWDVAGWGYPEFNYEMNENGRLVQYGHQPSDYLTDVIANKGAGFINRAAAAGKPFFLELATFAPHRPYTPAPRDARRFLHLDAPRPPSFDRLPTNAPDWLAHGHPRLSAAQLKQIDTVFRKRVRSVQSVDRMIGRIERTLQADGVAGNTYIVFSSDNGLHTGEYRLMPGKLTAFDTDIHVPLVVAGPGVAPGTQTPAMAENIDLADTFTAIGGTSMPTDGHSLTPLFASHAPVDWRDAVLVEHHGPDLSGGDPDFQQPPAGSPRTYEAMRTPQLLFVQYDDNEHELYDLQTDPFELHNIWGAQAPAVRRALRGQLLDLEECHNGDQCWQAGHVDAALPLVAPSATAASVSPERKRAVSRAGAARRFPGRAQPERRG